MGPIIRVEKLSKRYRLGASQRGPTSLRETLAGLVRSPLKRLRRGDGNSPDETVWALRDVSFEVLPGEVVGVIGRNGAGKSTLLKILSRITRPTRGRVALHGRVGSLLEVGTGFHSELTGRENVFLNGAILGMSREEIKAKFDEIVAFAETEKFLDTPVKHYSTGMTVRLAFAVAAHLEPEIMIVDEVLAVGDAAFQKKCLGKMSEVARAGRTVLFVSHDLSAVNALCGRAVLLNEGRVVMTGRTRDVTEHYLDRVNKLYSPITWFPVSGAGSGEIQLNNIAVTQGGSTTGVVSCREPFTVAISYEIKQPVRGSRFFLIVRNGKGELIFTTSDYDVLTPEAAQRGTGKFVSRVEIPGGLLKTGAYYGTLGVDVAYERVVFAADDAFHFDVYEPEDDTLATRHKRVGAVAPLLRWEIRREEDASA
ncbi:MAG TPA: ABC transporter ATP-binding protein [Pyrinomonadaceae bacterium]|jgi:lipopolysaccharide transport system ATP-binding protein